MDKLKSTLDSASGTAKEQVSNAYNQVNDKTGGSGSKAGEYLSQGKDQASSAIDSAKQKAQKAMGQEGK
ncbi:hypothetical protein BDV59DRAFT_204085 [Aspergillus ambiguus]|uniref:uncharacterized protein n=1 Tax=Aspergillus ambiguus TaxID=176160 RepID=UPI003CCE13B1